MERVYCRGGHRRKLARRQLVRKATGALLLGVSEDSRTGALAHLGVARANALESKSLQGAEADAARARALAAYKDFLDLWTNADPDIPIYKAAKREYARLQ